MYDHIYFHTEEGYSGNLPPENAATHIGMYRQWAVQVGLANLVWQAASETAAGFAAMVESRFSGTQLLPKYMDGVFTLDDFNPFGQNFTSYYYDDEEEGYGIFMEDHIRTLDTSLLGDLCYVEDPLEIYAKLAPVFQTTFEKWKNSLAM